jgi:hypothetical protein
MKPITQLNPLTCPRAFAAVSALLAQASNEGKEIAIYKGLAYAATCGGIYHVAIWDSSTVEPYANDWTDESFGFPPRLAVFVTQGDIEPHKCEVDQPNGVSAGELLAESQARLCELLTKQESALPEWEASNPATGESMTRAEWLAHEITNTLASIQRLAATPANRCLA